MALLIPPTPPNNVITLGDYHAYWIYPGGVKTRNPDCDQFSVRILNLKNKYPEQIKHFYTILNNLFRDDIAIAIVPSHDPAKLDSGIKLLAKSLITNTQRIDATDCLRRTVKVEKLATGGSRSQQVHLSSIVVEQQHLIKNRDVLLLDDVTTSHNSLLACQQLLLNAGAKSVQGYALGQTV